ncbi:MAG: ATP-binding cassette domain-containing protein [Actinomycetota bacterium]|nr:ATP-binding cassette domain-containing protein [Actinomycetota bacterium]
MLAVHEVARRYDDVVALDGVSLEVGEGEVVGLLGPNGAGKTTAMQIVMGVRSADHGQIRWRGRTPGRAERLRFGYMPEARGLYPRMRVRDHLVFLARLHGLDPAAAEANVNRWLGRLGVAERAGSRVEELSSGNQQRVQLAAALVHDPELLVLDDPFSGLDPVAVDALREIMGERIGEGAGVLLSTHQLDLAATMCRSVVIIDGGRVVLSGRVDDLRRQGPRRLRLRAAPSSRWASKLRGIDIEEETDGDVLVRLDDGVDEQAVLQAALEAGPVRHFAFELPSLSEVYRRAVGG